MWPSIAIFLVSVFIASVSQVLLKKSAQKSYANPLKEYLNPLVICAYFLLFATTLLAVYAYRNIPLSLGPVLEATSYLYVTLFGVALFKERFNIKKAISLALILLGIAVYSFSLG